MPDLVNSPPGGVAPCPLPESVQQVREAYRTHEVPRSYQGHRHLLFTSLFCLGGIGLSVWLLRDTAWWEWLTIPITFLYANFAEYIGHRGPMHRRKAYAPMIFDGHTGIHHRFFTEDAFAYESHRDWHALLLPAYMVVFFLGLFVTPVAVLLYFVISPNVGYLTAATGLAYFVSYEWMHFCYHAPEDSILLRIPFMRSLRRHHMAHHNLRLMSRFNFNITFPIFDWLLGTTYRQGSGVKTDDSPTSPADELTKSPTANAGRTIGADNPV